MHHFPERKWKGMENRRPEKLQRGQEHKNKKSWKTEERNPVNPTAEETHWKLEQTPKTWKDKNGKGRNEKEKVRTERRKT